MRKFTNLQEVKEYVRSNSDLLTMITDDVGDIDWHEEHNTFTCCSPFRDESNPSFKVNNNRFKDWGGEQYSGDIFTWTQIWHNVSFIESIYIVANRFNIDLSKFYKEQTQEEKLRSRYIDINNAAADFFHSLLCENTIVKNDYLSKSCFTLDQIKPYKVGYSSNIGAIISYLSNKLNITDDEVSKLEFYREDLFNDAIVYPIQDQYGDTLKFYTKQLSSGSVYKGVKADHPLNDPTILYGMHVARKNIKNNNGRLVVVEGFRDAIALQAAGCMGSVLTEKQIENLKQYKLKTIVCCYDGDQTGWIKSLGLVEKPYEVNDALILVARPDIDKDPHEVWMEGGDKAINELLDSAQLPLEYYINSKYINSTFDTLTSKQLLLRDLKDYISQLSNIQLELTIQYLSNILQCSKESLYDYISEVHAEYSELYNLEAERTLLAACLTNHVSLSTAMSAGIIPDSFTFTKYKKIYSACCDMKNEYGDKYTPQAVLDKVMVDNPDPEYINTMNIILNGNYRYSDHVACDKVIDMWRRRTALKQAEELTSSAKNLSLSFTNILESHRKDLITAVSTSRPQARTPKELALEAYEEIKNRNKSGGNLIIGHSYHSLPSLNMILGGIQPAYTVIAGDSGSGKSLIGMNILKCLAIDANVPTLWIGQEMQSVYNTMRLISIMTGIDNTRIQSGNLTKRQALQIRDAYDKIAQSSYYMAKPRDGNIDEIVSIVDEYRWKYGIEVIIWDYIQLVTTAQGQERWSREQIIGHASKIVTNRFVNDMGLASIIIAQLNRDKMSQGQHKIAGSYQITQDCDNFIWIEKKTKEQIEMDGKAKGNRHITVGKRRGGVADFKINVNLMISPGNASLLMKDCSEFSDLGKLNSMLAS